MTTNPEILRDGKVTLADLPRLTAAWTSRGAREVFYQTWGATRQAALENARRLRDLGPEVCVKVPATATGFAVAADLVTEGVTVLVTAVYEPAQAVAAASIGARYIAPYLGRLDDAGRDGAETIGTMASMTEGTGTEVLVASLRSPERIVDLAMRGVNAFTAKPSVLRAALTSDASDAAAAAFEEAMTSMEGARTASA